MPLSDEELDLNLEHAEAEHAAHEAGECLDECPWCERLAEVGINPPYARMTRWAINQILKGAKL